VGVTVAELGIELHFLQGLHRPGIALPCGNGGFVHEQAFGDDLACCHAGRQGAEGILQHDLDLLPEGAHLFLAEPGNIAALKSDGPFAGQEAQQGAGQG